MIWKILIVILTLDLIKRAIQYGPSELRRMLGRPMSDKTVNVHTYRGATKVNPVNSLPDEKTPDQKAKEKADFIIGAMHKENERMNYKKNCIRG